MQRQQNSTAEADVLFGDHQIDQSMAIPVGGARVDIAHLGEHPFRGGFRFEGETVEQVVEVGQFLRLAIHLAFDLDLGTQLPIGEQCSIQPFHGLTSPIDG